MGDIKFNNLKTTFIAITIAVFGSIPILGFSQTYIPGETYFDATGFVEFRAGNLPIILSAPHGGSLVPDSIPDRDCTGCVYVKDAWTKDIAEEMYDAFFEQTGCYPYVIINLLHRAKFDANRAVEEAADGNPWVEQAWNGYHSFIDAAKAQIKQDYEKGLFLDIHGHAHAIQRIELGYLLSGAELRLSDEDLNTATYIEESSIRSLVGENVQALTHAALLRGELSFGTLMHQKGFPAVPSQFDSFPNSNEPYFEGGYNTQRHGSRGNTMGMDAIQIELNQNIRFDAATREKLIDSLTTSVNQYLDFHYHNQYLNKFCELILSASEIPKTEYEFHVFPNPVVDYLTLESNISVLEIMIYDLLGKQIHAEIWSGSNIEVGFLESGFYVVKLKKGELELGSVRIVKY